ncbi:MAG TPA: hypothetical protein VG826_02365 [Pirellulales bacterium]|nr:hypothetical protein [Pirellulales bacterium]
MATITRFDFGQFEAYNADASSVRPHPQQRFLTGMEGAQVAPSSILPRVQVTPLDDRLQPCGTPFLADAERRSSDTIAVWYARPVHVPYLAVDLPAAEGQHERVILRVTRCESFGLDYVIGGDVMGS